MQDPARGAVPGFNKLSSRIWAPMGRAGACALPPVEQAPDQQRDEVTATAPKTSAQPKPSDWQQIHQVKAGKEVL